MQRIPEPELMNDPAQALAYAEADFSEPHTAFVDGFVERFPESEPRQILDLGCGPGDITERFAQRYPDCHITAVDGAQTVLDLARQRACIVRRGGAPAAPPRPARGLAQSMPRLAGSCNFRERSGRAADRARKRPRCCHRGP